MSVSQPITFDCQGCNLYGTLKKPSPDSVKRKSGILLINAGPTDRAGPHRMYITQEEILSMLGYPVFRFDPRGVGESQGYWANLEINSPIKEIYKMILDGIWIDDTEEAIRIFMEIANISDVILAGHCGGAITSLIVGANHPNVSRMWFTGMPVTLSSASGVIEKLPDTIIERDFNTYIKNIFSLDAWTRFMTFKTDYKTMISVIKTRLKNKLSTNKDEFDSREPDNLNKLFINSYNKASSLNKKMLFVYGKNDYLWHEFKQYCLDTKYIKDNTQLSLNLIPDANHNMTEDKWQKQFQEILLTWLEDQNTY